MVITRCSTSTFSVVWHEVQCLKWEGSARENSQLLSVLWHGIMIWSLSVLITILYHSDWPGASLNISEIRGCKCVRMSSNPRLHRCDGWHEMSLQLVIVMKLYPSVCVYLCVCVCACIRGGLTGPDRGPLTKTLILLQGAMKNSGRHTHTRKHKHSDHHLGDDLCAPQSGFQLQGSKLETHSPSFLSVPGRRGSWGHNGVVRREKDGWWAQMVSRPWGSSCCIVWGVFSVLTGSVLTHHCGPSELLPTVMTGDLSFSW